MFFFLGTLMSQITINSSNVIGVNDIVINGKDTTPDASITPGSAGASQSWDFSALVAHYYDSIAFVLPSSTPYDANISGDNLAAYMDDFSGFGYFNKTSYDFQTLGIVGDIFGSGTMMTIEFNPTETIIKFPLDYLDSFSDTSGMEIIMDTIKMDQTTYKTVTADAWGSLTTPTGTYNVLRLYTEKIEIQDIYKWFIAAWVPLYSTSDTTFEYAWWSDDLNARYPVCSFNWNPDSMAIDGEVEFLDMNYVYSKQLKKETELLVYPNPSSGIINFYAENINSIEICDISGIEVYKQKFNSPVSHSTIDLSYLKNGIYFAKINNLNSSIVRKLIIE